jgi:hypothetical protein
MDFNMPSLLSALRDFARAACCLKYFVHFANRLVDFFTRHVKKARAVKACNEAVFTCRYPLNGRIILARIIGVIKLYSLISPNFAGYRRCYHWC